MSRSRVSCSIQVTTTQRKRRFCQPGVCGPATQKLPPSKAAFKRKPEKKQKRSPPTNARSPKVKVSSPKPTPASASCIKKRPKEPAAKTNSTKKAKTTTSQPNTSRPRSNNSQARLTRSSSTNSSASSTSIKK